MAAVDGSPAEPASDSKVGPEGATATAEPSPARAVSEVYKLFEEHGEGDYIGEAVTYLEHALQCAKLAKDAGSQDVVVIGALLHDVGHLIGLREGGEEANRMGGCGVMHHERIGRAWLEGLGFPISTVEVVEGHVQAKRYLCWKHPDYHSKLSGASKTTLTYQGGVMTDAEAHAFERSPLFDTIIKMRSWDEKAKIKGLDVPGLDEYSPMIETIVGTNLEIKKATARAIAAQCKEDGESKAE